MFLTDLFTNWEGYAESDIPAPPGIAAQYLIYPVFRFLIMDPWLISNAGLGGFITSGYRDPQHNIEVGGVQGSAHTFGVGSDITQLVNNPQLAASWEDDFSGSYAKAYSDGHLHVNLSRAAAWKILRIEIFVLLLLLVAPILYRMARK